MNDDTEKAPGTTMPEGAKQERRKEPNESIFDGAVQPTDKPPRKELPTSEVPDLGGEID